MKQAPVEALLLRSATTAVQHGPCPRRCQGDRDASLVMDVLRSARSDWGAVNDRELETRARAVEGVFVHRPAGFATRRLPWPVPLSCNKWPRP